MCIISIDRYCVVVHPFGSRITNLIPMPVMLFIIWFVSCLFAIPFAIYNEVSEVNLIVKTMIRCLSLSPNAQYERYLTVLSFSTQYVIPLSIATISYCCIVIHMKKRRKLGTMTRTQLNQITKY